VDEKIPRTKIKRLPAKVSWSPPLPQSGHRLRHRCIALVRPAYHFSELVLTEAFDRLGLSFSLQNHPSSRVMEMVTQGIADGDSCRIEYLLDLGDFPNHVRVDEPILLHFSYAYVIDEDIEIQGWDSLKNTNYRVGYARGVRYVEKALRNVVSDDYIFIVTDATTGFEMLESDRIDVLVAGLTPLPSKYEDGSIRRAGVLQESRIYSYMNKKHSELAKQLSETLRTMKSQGLFQEYERQLGVTIAAE